VALLMAAAKPGAEGGGELPAGVMKQVDDLLEVALAVGEA
jgi:hypothetical protein